MTLLRPFNNFDYTSYDNPAVDTNPPSVAMTWCNLTTGEVFVCTDNAIDSNIWVGSITIIDNSLILDYDFLGNVTSTTVIDLSGNSNDGTLNNCTVSTNGVIFNGSSSYIDTGYNSLNVNFFTIIIGGTNYVVGSHETISGADQNTNASEDAALYYLKISDPSTQASFSRDSSSISSLTSSKIPKDFIITGVADNSSSKLFSFGLLVGESTGSVSLTSQSTSIKVGCGYFARSLVDFFSGELIFFRLFNRPLSDAEVFVYSKKTTKFS